MNNSLPTASPYVKHPLIAKIAQRLSLFITYLSTGYVGILIEAGHTTFSEVIHTGWIIVVASAMSLVGVAISQYRLEWISQLPLATGLLIAAVSIMNMSTGFAAGLLVAVSSFILYRFVVLTVIAASLRQATRHLDGIGDTKTAN